MISELATQVRESTTLTLNAAANRLRAKGEAVIHLGSGEPKIKTPLDAILAASAKLNAADIKYTPTSGTPELKAAITRYTDIHYGHKVQASNILASAGAKQALYSLLLSILDPGDEALILAPYWVSYPDMVGLCRAVPVIVPPTAGSFTPDIRDIEARVTPKTKALIVNSPNNPSGEVYPEAFIQEIVEFCERRSIFLIMDDIYHQLLFDGRAPVSCYRFAHDLSDNSRLVVINGVSKLYGMTGFRIGWAVANPTVIAAMNKIQAQSTSCPSALLQAAAVGALNGDQGCVTSLRLMLQNNRDIIIRELQGLDRVRLHVPGGTFYCLPDFSAYNKDSIALSNFLLERALVVAVPGKEFGMEGHLRLSYCGSAKDCIEGVARIKWALDPAAPREIHIGDRLVTRDW